MWQQNRIIYVELAKTKKDTYRRSKCREACLRFVMYVLVQILSNVENLL